VEHQVLVVHLEHQVVREHQELVGLQVQVVVQDLAELVVHQVLVEHQEHRVHQEVQVLVEHQVLVVLQVLQVQVVLQVVQVVQEQVVHRYLFQERIIQWLNLHQTLQLVIQILKMMEQQFN
jgi:hypothetical protein